MKEVNQPGQLKGTDFLRWASLVLDDPSFTKQVDSHHEITGFARFERPGAEGWRSF